MTTALSTRPADFNRLVSLVSDGKSENTKVAYGRALRHFRDWFDQQEAGYKIRHGFSRVSVNSYLDSLKESGLSAATINQKLAALRQLAKELRYSGAITNDQAAAIIDIKSMPVRGTRTGHWLTPRQSKRLLGTPDPNTLKGRRELVIIALLLGCALRREEAANLTCDQIQPRNDHWVIVNLEGKGNRTRTIPISPWAIDLINDWQNATGIKDGKLLRAVNRNDNLTGPVVTKNGKVSDGGLSPQAIYNIVKSLVKRAKLPDLGPHSLRRTWAKAAYQQNAPLGQISLILGHASIQTTEIYLGIHDVDLENPVYVVF